MKPPVTQQASGCPSCQQAPSRQDGCSHVDCPRRRPWGCAVPREQDCEPIRMAGGTSIYGLKVRAKRGAE